ncbi:Binding-protein-dependent transport system inner membrane component [Paenibacillus sp. UNC496MF]|uniref:ABC transporter permease subunit n=1 Tax=Paenibacillus sp. UNC496MF TaxID=1502753 RepID=UPI0008E4DDB1|nr:ABC transporter permease subunit [Paenibacillus sp. UNC496MF]SFJ35025.1 Binding-protein-dependent transport system inner membrane component [Paenibacillus sp. UNC496MF]
MTKVTRYIFMLLGTLSFVLAFATFPAVLKQSAFDGSLRFHWSEGWTSLARYLEGIANGDSFRCLAGQKELPFFRQIGSSFMLSLIYLATGAAVGLTMGIALGIHFALSRAKRLRRLLDVTGVLPDFVIVLLLQFAIVLLSSATGLLLVQVASITADRPAVALPLLSTIIVPSGYMIRNVALHMSQTLTEDYIMAAKARGLKKRYRIFFHALPNVLPFIKADANKFLAILFGNLFIFEYLYNLNGVTAFVFANAYTTFKLYQYNLVVNGILTLLLLYAILFALVRALLFGWEKVFAR